MKSMNEAKTKWTSNHSNKRKQKEDLVYNIYTARLEGASVGQKKRERERMEMEEVFCVVL
jgi:hypothetical protein